MMHMALDSSTPPSHAAQPTADRVRKSDDGDTMSAVVVTEFGGADLIGTTTHPVPHPDAADEVLIKVTHAGVNFGDIASLNNGDNHIRKSSVLPYVPGSEVVGRRMDSGKRVIALCGHGGHAEYVLAPEDLVFDVPDEIDAATALAVFVTGVTAWYLVYRSARVEPGDHVLIQAAGGAVGAIAVQLATAAGASVVGAASSPDRRAEARRMGARAVTDSMASDAIAQMRAAGPRQGFDVVMDCSGASTFSDSVNLLAPFGRAILFGTPSGPPSPVPPAMLIAGSRSIGGFWLMDAFAQPEQISTVLDDLWARVLDGSLRPLIGRTYRLDQAQKAYESVAQRLSRGKVVLIPHGEDQ